MGYSVADSSPTAGDAIQISELDGGSEAQVSASDLDRNLGQIREHFRHQRFEARNGFASQADYLSFQDINDVLEKIKVNLAIMRELHRRALLDFDPANPTHLELHKYSMATKNLCRDLTEFVTRSQPHPAWQPPLAQLGREVVNQYQTVISDFLHALRLQMADKYRQVRPEATDLEVVDALKDVPSRNFSVSVRPLVRQAEPPEDPSC